MEIGKDLINPLLLNGVSMYEVNRDIKEEPKYKVGEVVDLETWGGTKKDFEIKDIKVTYHSRMNRYCWGYRMKDDKYSGLNFTYIPEGYLRKQVKEEKSMKESKETNNKERLVTRPSKDEYYLGIAEAVLERATCLRRKYGAVLVKDDQIVSTGYNGAVRGEANCCDTGVCEREAQGVPKGERYELCVALHAEENAIIHAGREKALGATLYIVGKNTVDNSYASPCPCMMCRRKIVNAGISRVVGLFVEDGNKEIRDIDFRQK